MAAYAYRAISGQRHRTVIVLGPLHAAHVDPLLTSAFDAYRTPLGPVSIDRGTVERIAQVLEQDFGRRLAAVDETSEHSIEVQLPFLQVVLGEFQLVPIMLADQSGPVARHLAAALQAAFGGRLPLLLASSDLSHYFPQPVAERLDRELLRRVERLDPEAVLQAERQRVGYACGNGAIAAALWAVRPARARLLRYATSGDVTGDYSSVVGYAAVGLYGSDGAAQ